MCKQFENSETGRTEFAQMVIDLALQCQDNNELLVKLESCLPPDFLVLIGVGSTRICCATPLGVTLKLQRETTLFDPLSDEELEERGGNEYLPVLYSRRRMANLSELIFAAHYPRLMPRQYGFLASFGFLQKHPSVLVAETVKTLDRYFPGDGIGIAPTDMAIDAHGILRIFDDRITERERPAHLTPLEQVTSSNESEIWLGNLGVTAAGNYVFVDRSDHSNALSQLNPWNYSPTSWGLDFQPSSALTIDFSKRLFALYEDAWRAATT